MLMVNFRRLDLVKSVCMNVMDLFIGFNVWCYVVLIFGWLKFLNLMYFSLMVYGVVFYFFVVIVVWL